MLNLTERTFAFITVVIAASLAMLFGFAGSALAEIIVLKTTKIVVEGQVSRARSHLRTPERVWRIKMNNKQRLIICNNIKYELAKGTHTYTMCKCNRRLS